jgi:acetylornithine deacetylase/succinyl-diaminopimelate desuccinylase-like protein
MKGQVAATAVAFASLAREGFEPHGDVILAATADEEVGDGFGLSWLCDEHPDAVRCDYAVNEGGGDRVELAGGSYYFCTTAEKMTAPFRVLVHGRSGHASMPGIADNALVHAATLIERIAAYVPEPQIQQEVEAFFRTVVGEVPAPHEAAARAREVSELAGALIEALLAPTFAPTRISASQKRNVIPALCEVEVDCRILPGQSPAELEPIVRAALGNEIAYDLEFLEAQGGTRSALDTPLWAAVESFVAEVDPEARALPGCSTGFTDSHWLREAFGTVAYGFCPARAMPVELAATLVHSADERVPIADLELGVQWLRHAVRAVCS